MPICPRCQRATHVRGGYWERRQADYWACWWCCFEWETPSVTREAERLAHEAAQAAQDAVEALEHLERYGLPVIAPLTPGTLRGFAQGGWITEPTPLSGPSSTIHRATHTHPLGVNITVSGADALRDRATWERIVDRLMR